MTRRTRGRDIPSGALPARVHRDGSIQRSQLAGDVTGKQVRPGSINGQHLEAQSVRIKHLHPEMLPYPPATSASTAVVVAANDAPSWIKDVAPFVCDHSNDNLTVAEAITYAAGQPVVLSEGTFHFETAGVTLTAGSLLTGAGRGTIIYGPDSDAAVTGGGFCQISHLRFNFYDTGSGAVGVQAGNSDAIDHCWFEDLATGIDLASANDPQVSRCFFTGITGWGIDDTLSSGAAIDRCWFEFGDGGDCLRINGNTAIITGCHFLDDTVTLEGDSNMLVDNYFDTDAFLTIGTGGNLNVIAGNYLAGGSADYTDSGTNTQKPTNGNYSNAGLW